MFGSCRPPPLFRPTFTSLAHLQNVPACRKVPNKSMRCVCGVCGSVLIAKNNNAGTQTHGNCVPWAHSIVFSTLSAFYVSYLYRIFRQLCRPSPHSSHRRSTEWALIVYHIPACDSFHIKQITISFAFMLAMKPNMAQGICG